jgi:hypothetical protein
VRDCVVLLVEVADHVWLCDIVRVVDCVPVEERVRLRVTVEDGVCDSESDAVWDTLALCDWLCD